MATDYDAPRRGEEDSGEESLQEVKARRADKSGSSSVEVDEAEQADRFELPGADLSDLQLTVQVIPQQADEFTCSRCFMVRHRSQLADTVNGQPLCRDCAG